MSGEGRTGPAPPSPLEALVAEGVIYLGRIAAALEELAAAPRPTAAPPPAAASQDGRRPTPRVERGDWTRDPDGKYRLRQLPQAALDERPAYCRDCEARVYWVEDQGGNRRPMDADGRKHWDTCPNAPQREGETTRSRTTAPRSAPPRRGPPPRSAAPSAAQPRRGVPEDHYDPNDVPF